MFIGLVTTEQWQWAGNTATIQTEMLSSLLTVVFIGWPGRVLCLKNQKIVNSKYDVLDLRRVNR